MIKQLSTALADIVQTGKKKKIFFCLDYDGTLTAIRKHPEKVRPSKTLLKFLKKAAAKEYPIAIISGRALSDLKKQLPMKGLLLAGSHGLELHFVGRKRGRAKPKIPATFARIREEWEEKLGRIPGIYFETKPFSFVLHYRGCSNLTQARLKPVLVKEMIRLQEQGLAFLTARKAIEIFMEKQGDKGSVVAELMRKNPAKRFFMAGDDLTDRQMFARARKKDWSVSIARKDLGAGYFVKGTNELMRLLLRIISG